MRFKSSAKLQPELVASREQSRPVLTKVHLNAEESVVEVTNSYMLARFPVKLDKDDTSGPIPVEALKASRKPPLKGHPVAIRANSQVDVAMNPDDGNETYLTVPRESADYQFPRTSQLIPEHTAEFEIGLDADFLLKLAKAMGDTRVRLTFTADRDENGMPEPSKPSALRPIVVRPLGGDEDEPLGLLMPIRLAS